MGNFKNKGMESVKEMRENSRETTDLGSEMQEKAEQINQILEGIQLQDDEDVSAVGDTKGSYQKSYDSAFSDQVETAGLEIEKQGEQLRSEIGAEQENVRRGIQSMERAGGVSEIGRDAADAGRSRLEQSEREYEGIASDAERVADETAQKIEQLKNSVSRIFG
ncbi:MAG: hypothetical protein FWF10_09665 [Clostridiales bacterium]|nr:hypothetical protein [Clostridiales bacterium]